jgi:PAT family beta-lactamase induction signal transducer AmpG
MRDGRLRTIEALRHLATAELAGGGDHLDHAEAGGVSERAKRPHEPGVVHLPDPPPAHHPCNLGAGPEAAKLRRARKKLAARGRALDHRSKLMPPKRSNRALLWTSTTYFGEGLPWSFMHQMALQFLTEIRASNTAVGMTSALHFATMLKFLWSPIVDLFGRLRTWVWTMQIILGLGMFGVASLSSRGNSLPLWLGLATLAILLATHDIACDGFYLQALDRRGQSLYAGTRIAAFQVAKIVGSSVLVVLAAHKGWRVGFSAAGALMLLTAATNRAVMPHPTEHHTPAARPHAGTTAKARAFGEAYRTFLSQPNAALVLAFLVFYRIGDIMMFGMSQPFLRDIGVDTKHRGILVGLSITASIAGAIVGGAIVARKGLPRCLVPMTFLQNLAIPLYFGLATFRPKFAGILPVVLVEQFVAGIGQTNFSVFQMQRCRADFSAAHFAFVTAIVGGVSALSGIFAGPLSTSVGWRAFFALCFVATIPSLLLVFWVPKTPIEADGPAVGG